MSKEAVLEFCRHVSENRDLQHQIQSGLRAGKDLADFVSLGRTFGCEFTLQEAGEIFEEERVRRSAKEGGEHAETFIVQRRPGAADDGEQGMAGFRRVALSMNWLVGDGAEHYSGESIHD